MYCSGEESMNVLHRMKIVSVLLLVLFSLSACEEKTAKLKPLKIVCLGDSITYGFKLADPVRQSYPAQLEKLAHGQWRVLNCGVNGATVLNHGDIPITAQQAYQDAAQFQSDVVVLMLGTNGTKSNNWLLVDEFVPDYLELIRKIQGLPSHPHVIACSIPPIFVSHPIGLNGEREAEINGLVKKAVAASKVDFLDIYTPLSEDQSFFIDGIHPNSRGAQEIAMRVFDKITEL